MRRRQPILRFQLFSVENLESRLVMSAGSLAIIQPALIGSVEGGGLAWNWCGTTTSQSEEQAADVGAEIAAANVAPELAASINKAVFTLKAPAMVIDSGFRVADSDSPNFSTGKLTVTITGGAVKTDKLGIYSQGVGINQVSVKRSTVLFEDILVGTFTGGTKGKPLVVTFNSAATVAAVRGVARAVTFSAAGKAVSPPRTVQLQATDGDGGTSDPVQVQVGVETLAGRSQAPAVFGGTRGRSDDISGGLDAQTRHRAEQITSTFEHGTTVLQYDSIHKDEDGRGYTAGFAGFTTGTGDFLEVVQEYSKRVPNNPLQPYLKPLEKLVGQKDSTKGLTGIEAAWQQAAADDVFHQVQDDVNSKNSYVPAVTSWRALGLQSNLSLAALYDAAVQHGPGQDPGDDGYADGLAVMIDRASARAGGTPAAGVAESKWLSNFLQVRRESLAYAQFSLTREAWSKSVERVDVYRNLLADGNLNLDGPISFHVDGGGPDVDDGAVPFVTD